MKPPVVTPWQTQCSQMAKYILCADTVFIYISAWYLVMNVVVDCKALLIIIIIIISKF